MTETTISSRLSRTEASRYLAAQHGVRRKPATLAKYACIGGGPAFRKVGSRSVVYDLAALDAWANDIVSGELRSTSEAE